MNDWNYIVEINGSRKVISISKMRHYKANKYTPSSGLDSRTTATAGEPAVSLPPIDRKRPLLEREDSSDDDHYYLVPQIKRRSRRIAGLPPASPVPETVDNFAENSGGIIASSPTSQQNDNTIVASSENLDNLTERIENQSNLRDTEPNPLVPSPSNADREGDISQLDSTFTSDAEYADALEAQDDANISREGQYRATGSPGMDFQSIDNSKVTLSDIERHQKKGTLENRLRSGELDRTISAPHLSPGPSTSRRERSSTKYNLRKNPKKLLPFQLPGFSKSEKSKKKK